MKVEIPADGMIDGALFVNAEEPYLRQQIIELYLNAGRLAVIASRGDYFVVEFLTKSYDHRRQIHNWSEERSSSTTNTIEHARRLAEDFAETFSCDTQPVCLSIATGLSFFSVIFGVTRICQAMTCGNGQHGFGLSIGGFVVSVAGCALAGIFLFIAILRGEGPKWLYFVCLTPPVIYYVWMSVHG